PAKQFSYRPGACALAVVRPLVLLRTFYGPSARDCGARANREGETMNSSTCRGGLSLAALALACVVSCKDSPQPIRPTPPQAPPSGPVLWHVVVTGPTTVHIGEPSRFTAKATYTDGSERDVTQEAKWQVGSGRLSLRAPGEVVGMAPGESSVTAVFEVRSGVISGIVVVPPGTYHLRGTVRDAGKPLY